MKEITSEFNIFVLDKQCKINKELANFIQSDINKRFFYKDIINLLPKNSFVINLAARQYADNPPRNYRLDWFLKTNYYGSKNVLDLVSKIKAKGFIQFSTDMVYGIPSFELIDENHPINPIGEYGLSKMKIENYINKNRNKFNFPISIMRPRMIIGKRSFGCFKKIIYIYKK